MDERRGSRSAAYDDLIEWRRELRRRRHAPAWPLLVAPLVALVALVVGRVAGVW
jgi:hypothetical protein